MMLLKKIGEAVLIAGFSFLLLLVFFESRMHLPPWVQVIGRMHPVFLHFPIVLLLLYFFTLWTPLRENESIVYPIRLLASLTAVLTAVMGLLLSLEESREGTTFLWHKWGGVSVAVMAFLFYYLHPSVSHKKWIARPLTLVVSLLLLFTGHWGAGLTHGDNYLLAPMALQKEKVPLDQATAFEHVVLPVFQEKCSSCHSASSSKGGLVLEDSASVLEGGKGGPLFVAGQPEKSLLIKRILLPLDHKKHMAPKAKPQLTDEEVQLLQAWVKAGAPMNKKIISLPVQDSFRLLAANYLAPAANGVAMAYDFPPADEATVKALNNNYRLVVPLGAKSPALSVQFYGQAGYSAKALEELLSVKEQITELSLAKLPVKDEDLKPVLQMKNLRKLNLNYTDVTDNGLRQITALKNLEELSLSGTKVSVPVAAQLAKMPTLTALFVWNTSLDSTAVASLKNANKGLVVESGYKDDGKILLPLNPPVAKTVPGIYEPQTPIELKHAYRGVEIRYTLDNTEPDSVNSAIYKVPLTLQKFTVVIARAFKPGWYGSKTMKAVYFPKGAKPDSITMSSEDQTSKEKQAQLFDGEIGDLNLGSGAWIELKKPATFDLFFNQPTALHQMGLNMFVRTEWDIFPAKQVEVWGGMDEKGMKRLGVWQQPPPTKAEDPDTKQIFVSFAETKLRCMKLVIYPLAAMPAWWRNKGKPSRVYVSEVVLN